MDAFEQPFYLSLHDTIHWIAFGHPSASGDNRAVEAWDRAEAELHHALQGGNIKACGLQRGRGEPTEIPKLFWAEAEMDPLEGYAWLRDQWPSQQDPPWQKIRFEREAVLALWPVVEGRRQELREKPDVQPNGEVAVAGATPPRAADEDMPAKVIVRDRRGRKQGQGSLAQFDKPLIEEMHKLVRDDKEEVSVYSAAQQVAGQAKGAGTLESKVDRLRKRYREEYPLKET